MDMFAARWVMTVKRLLLLIASFLFLLLDLPIAAQDKSKPASDSPPQVSASKPLEKWATEDVAYIIHPEERRAFLRLESAEGREKFIEQFWLRRDPTPGTIENEFKEEHYRRIAYANEHYASGIPAGRPTASASTLLSARPMKSNRVLPGRQPPPSPWSNGFIAPLRESARMFCSNSWVRRNPANTIALLAPPVPNLHRATGLAKESHALATAR